MGWRVITDPDLEELQLKDMKSWVYFVYFVSILFVPNKDTVNIYVMEICAKSGLANY